MQRPDVVLLDLVLPDGDGMDLFQDVESRATTEVVMITGHASIETSIEALRLGAADYLIKPVNIKQLKAILSRVARPDGSQEGNQRAARRIAQPRTLRQIARVVDARCRACTTRSRGWRRRWRPSSSPAKAARARNWWRRRFTI